VSRLRRADGEFRWHDIRAEPLRDRLGRVVQWYGQSVDIDEGKKAEDRLRRSEAYLAEAQRLSHTGTWAFDETTTLYWSDESYRIWGFDPLHGPPSREAMWERVHPDDRDRVRQGARQARRQRRDYAVEHRILLPDGTVRYIEATARFVSSTDFERFEVVGTHVDVTERKRAEEALREGEYKLRQIIETVPGLIWSSGPDAEPTHVNQRLLDYSGMRFEDFKHRGWEAFVHPADFPEIAKGYRHAFQTGTSYQGVMRLRRADGEFRWHHAWCEPLRDVQGHIIQWYGLSVDIDEAKKTEDRLRRSEAYLAEAQRLSHTGTAVYTGTTTLYFSDEAARIFGFDPLRGIPSREAILQRIHPDDSARVNENIERGLREKRSFSNEFRIILPDGTVKYIETTSHPVFSANGEPVEIIATGIDVTESKLAEALLRTARAELARVSRVTTLGQLTASIAHEVTQPIASARNNARAALNFLDRNPPDLIEVREALNCIVGDADRAGSIIDRIRDHTKKAPPRDDRFDLNTAINEVIALAKSSIAEYGVSVQTRLAERTCPVQGDRVQIQQVVLNLVLNAIEAMGSVEAGARELLISAEQSQKNEILVAVRDSGPGIGTESLKQVFEAFYTTKSGGMGMGLSICRSIIDAHGGRLWAEANETGGAKFQFTLPGAENELMNRPQPTPVTGEPREDTLVEASHQPASKGSKRLHPSKRGRGPDHRHRPSRGSSESGGLKR
jgi:PAS domain S-box-containing protein